MTDDVKQAMKINLIPQQRPVKMFVIKFLPIPDKIYFPGKTFYLTIYAESNFNFRSPTVCESAVHGSRDKARHNGGACLHCWCHNTMLWYDNDNDDDDDDDNNDFI